MTNIIWGQSLTEEQIIEIWRRFRNRKTVELFMEKLELLFDGLFNRDDVIKNLSCGLLEFEQVIIAKAEMETIISKVNEGNQLYNFTWMEIQKINKFLEMTKLGAKGKIMSIGNKPQVPISISLLDYNEKSDELSEVEDLINFAQNLNICVERFEIVLSKKDRTIGRLKEERNELFNEVDKLRQKVHRLELTLLEKH